MPVTPRRPALDATRQAPQFRRRTVFEMLNPFTFLTVGSCTATSSHANPCSTRVHYFCLSLCQFRLEIRLGKCRVLTASGVRCLVYDPGTAILSTNNFIQSPSHALHHDVQQLSFTKYTPKRPANGVPGYVPVLFAAKLDTSRRSLSHVGRIQPLVIKCGSDGVTSIPF